MRKKMGAVCFVLTCVFVLSGCLYPQSKKVENSVPVEEQVLAVQKAVNQFREEQGGLLPIKNQDATVPYYQKYPIDFNRLEKYLPEPPGNAYESGGVFQYVLIDVEDNPTVKLFDLRMASVLQEYNLRLSIYNQENEFPPFKEQLDTYVFTLDYEELGYEEMPVITSPYSQTNLSVVVDADLQLYIDYTPDLLEALENSESKFASGEDIRSVLTENSVFVPAFSLPYTLDESNQPVFMTN